MFQIYNIPRVNYSYYRPTAYFRRYIPVESYLLNSIREAQEIEKLKTILYNRLIQQQYKDQLSAKSEILNKQESKDNIKSNSQYNENNKNTDNNSQYNENNNNNNDNNSITNANTNNSNNANETKQNQIQSPSPFYYFESHSRFDGEKFIEERKERTIDSDGKIHQSLKRRIDDQWYETEQIEDENGQAVNKETWHNVSDDEVEKFKQEWISNMNQKLGLTENHKKEEKNEQEQIEIEKNEEENIQDEAGKEEIKDENQTKNNE